jgi:LPXTG-site transpeptidase (sortase) family protein
MNLLGTGRRLRLPAGAAVLLFFLAGCAAAGGSPEQPAPSSAAEAPPAPPSPEPTPTITAEPPPEQPEKEVPRSVELALDASKPVRLRIPALDRESELIQTGLRDDNRLEVPPGDEGSPASWYTGSSTPGEAGAAVLLGHVNSLTDKSGVFYDLKTLEKGDTISVDREDGATAVFEVYKVENYVKAEFPTKAVYYPVAGSELRLITCDGYDQPNRRYLENLVVYAELVDVEWA